MAILEPLEPGTGERRRYRLRNPATLEPLGEIEVASAADVRAAVGVARKAQRDWADARFDERAHVTCGARRACSSSAKRSSSK